MDPAQGPAQHQQVIEIVQLRGVAAAALEQGETETVELVQGIALCIHHGRHHGDLRILQLQAEGVLLEDLGVAPALRAIELCDQRRIVFDADLVDAVFVAVQRQQSRVTEIPGGLDGVDDHVGAEAVVGMFTHGDRKTPSIRPRS